MVEPSQCRKEIPDPDGSPSRDRPEQQNSDGRGLQLAVRILLIEDNRDAAVMLAAILTSNGHEVRTVHSGRSGIIHAKSTLPDAIISDIGLPDLSGYEIAKQLRSDARFKNTPMIAVTGYGQLADREKATEAGFNHFVLKPYKAEELLALLTRREPESDED